VFDEDPAPLPKRGRSPPIFGTRPLWPNGYMDKDGTEVGLGLRDIMLDRDPAPPSLKGHSPQFSVYVRCGQTAGWTKMPLGMEVRLGPGDFVFDGDPAISRKRAHPPHPSFGPCLLWPNGWMDEDATCYGSRPRPRPHIVLNVSQFSAKGAHQPPSFRPMTVVATVAHLSYC